MRVELSWMAIAVGVGVVYMLFLGLANPRTRPFVGCLGVLVGLVVFFGFFWAIRTVRVPAEMRAIERVQADQMDRMMRQQWEQNVALSPTPSPAKDSGHAQANRPKTTLIAALRKAVVYALTTRDPMPVAETTPKPAIVSPPVVQKPAAPDWADYVEPRMLNGVYEMSVLVGPFTTQLECERELPKAVQRAVSEYADLSLGQDAARITLPDDELKGLVQARVTDARQMEIDGGSREMYSLHALVVFDTDMQQRLKSEAQRPVIGQRVKIAAAIFGGVMGLLALTWGGLRWATGRKSRSFLPKRTNA